MLRLRLTNEPEWLDMPLDVRVLCRPISSEMMLAAQSDPRVRTVDPDVSDREIGAVMAKAIARRAIIEWEGVGDQDGNVIDPSPEAIDQLMNVWPIFEAFQAKYVARVFDLSAEGNALPPSPSGNSEGAENTAKPAKGRARRARGKSTSR